MAGTSASALPRSSAAAASTTAAPAAGPQDTRVMLHFDCDCFYAQVEELRNPALAGKPLAVTQKYLVVTCNYPARAAGVTKLMATTQARARCPELVLVSGEDLMPYRAASKSVLAVLQRYGPAEKLGLDEVFVDVSQEVHNRIAAGMHGATWRGHLHSSSVRLHQDSLHRPQDLRAPTPEQQRQLQLQHQQWRRQQQQEQEQQQQQQQQEQQQPPPYQQTQHEGWNSAAFGADSAAARDYSSQPWCLPLMVGSMVAAEARAAVKFETGFRCSAGIAANKMCAKLASGLHKPDDQTILVPTEAEAFVAPLRVRSLPGVGHKAEAVLAGLGISTVAQLRELSRGQLVQEFGAKMGEHLYGMARGLDPTPVTPRGAPKSITVEDSFKSCCTYGAAAAVLQVLVPDLLARLHEEYQENRRRPQTLTLKWRKRGNGWSRTSASCPMPLPPLTAAPTQQQAAIVVSAALQLLKQQLPEPFSLSLINIGATNFKDCGNGATAPAIQRLLSGSNTNSRGPADPARPGQRPGCDEEGAGIKHAANGVPAVSAADASMQHRRDYGSSPCGQLLMSKSSERALREQGALPSLQSHVQLQQQGQQVEAGTTWPSQHQPRHQQQQQRQQQQQQQQQQQLPFMDHGVGSPCSDGPHERPLKQVRLVSTGASGATAQPQQWQDTGPPLQANGHAHALAAGCTTAASANQHQQHEQEDQQFAHVLANVRSYDLHYVPGLEAMVEFEVVEGFDTDDND